MISTYSWHRSSFRTRGSAAASKPGSRRCTWTRPHHRSWSASGWGSIWSARHDFHLGWWSHPEAGLPQPGTTWSAAEGILPEMSRWGSVVFLQLVLALMIRSEVERVEAEQWGQKTWSARPCRCLLPWPCTRTGRCPCRRWRWWCEDRKCQCRADGRRCKVQILL